MLEVISVLPLLTAPVEIPTVTDLLEEKEQELHLLIEENTEQTQQELAQQLEAELEERAERERREEAERQAEQARAEEARRAAEEEARADREALQAEDTGVGDNVQTDYAKWEPIAVCESGYGGPPQWDLNTGNGYYGGLQFALSSWRWVGGEGYPYHASKEEQIKRAEILLERQGWVAWPACSKKVGYR